MAHTLFSLPSPWLVLDRYFHPAYLQVVVQLNGLPLLVDWTQRADRQLHRQQQPLYVEMQLYFSCVVKKRVLFHPLPSGEILPWVRVNELLQVAFRPVQAESCDPQAFARHYPVGRVMDSAAARKMHPDTLSLDYRRGDWSGEFQL